MSASSSPSPSRAQELLHEAIELEAEEIYLQTDGEKAKVRYRVSGRIVQKLDGFISDAQNVFDELKALPTQVVLAEENEGMGYFSFSVENRAHWLRLYWFRDEEGDAVVISMLERWLSLSDLGLSQSSGAILDELVGHSRGVVVGCGATGSGRTTTATALMERLAQNGHKVVSLVESSDPRLQGVTQIEIESHGFAAQVELLAGHFDTFSLGNLDSEEKIRAAFALARDGHLVLGISDTPLIVGTLRRFLASGVSQEELQADFLGGWSQTLVPRINAPERTGLFYCLSREEAKRHLAGESAHHDLIAQAEAKALWSDAEAKIAARLITREEAERVLPHSSNSFATQSTT